MGPHLRNLAMNGGHRHGGGWQGQGAGEGLLKGYLKHKRIAKLKCC